MTDIRVGARFYSAVSAVEVIVVKAASVELACAGEPMSATATGATGGDGAILQLGKRYEDAESGLAVMCTKPGAGPVTADGRELQILAAKPLPSSD